MWEPANVGFGSFSIDSTCFAMSGYPPKADLATAGIYEYTP